MLTLRCLYGWAQSSARWWSFCRCHSPPQQGTERLERFWNDCFISGMPRSVWSRPVATGRSTCSCMDVRSFKKTGRAEFIHWNEKHGYLVQCSSSIRIRSDTSKRTTPDHARKTNARSRHAAPRRASLVRWCAVFCQSRAVPCRTSLTSMTARSRTPAVNSGRLLRCSANSDNRTAQPQSPRQPSTAVVMRRTSLPSGPTSESIQIMHT